MGEAHGDKAIDAVLFDFKLLSLNSSASKDKPAFGDILLVALEG